MNLNEFKSKLADRGLILSDEQLSKFQIYSSFLKEYNEKVNLTAITEDEEIIEKHFYDCLLCSLTHKLTGSLVDVGSGAGFPGVVLKIAYPDLKVILLEPINKRCIFLKELINKLSLKDIEIINSRGEDYSADHREMYDYVTARAVSNLNALIEVSGAMVKVGGYFIALRGQSGKEELEGAKKAFKEMSFQSKEIYEEHLPDGSNRVIAFIEKTAKTNKKYPRKYSIIKQRPL